MRKQPVTAPQPIKEAEPRPSRPGGTVAASQPDEDDTRIVFSSWDEPLVPND